MPTIETILLFETLRERIRYAIVAHDAKSAYADWLIVIIHTPLGIAWL
jgi:hypothetical protein